MRILSGVEQTIGRGLSAVARSKVMTNQLEKGFKSPEAFAVTMAITSLVSKDTVNCYYYVTQSLNNEKIPEDKRKFVAALDLMNGIMNVVGQILVGMLAEKALSKYVFNKSIIRKIDEDTLTIHARKIVKNSAQKLDIEKVKTELIKKYGKEGSKFKGYQGGVKLLIAFLLTAAFAKRVLTPLIATPLAGWFKDKYMKDTPTGNKAKSKFKPEPKKDEKSTKTPEELDAELLSHESAPWAHSPENTAKSKPNKFS